MAKSEARQTTKRKSQPELLPFTTTNYWILAGGLALIAAGYIALAQKPWDGFFPLVVAPILLVLGYVFVIPYGILHRDRSSDAGIPATGESQSPSSHA